MFSFVDDQIIETPFRFLIRNSFAVFADFADFADQTRKDDFVIL
jgi:hypothetical protein